MCLDSAIKFTRGVDLCLAYAVEMIRPTEGLSSEKLNLGCNFEKILYCVNVSFGAPCLLFVYIFLELSKSLIMRSFRAVWCALAAYELLKNA